MPTITIPLASSAYVLAKPFYYVYAKRFWGGSWQYIPYVQPVFSDDQTSPQVGSAGFNFDFGYRNVEGDPTFRQMDPYVLRNYYVRIDVQYPGEQLYTAWMGRLIDDRYNVENPTRPSGVQQMKAYSFAHDLDRIDINFSVVTSGDLSTHHTIQKSDTFNYAPHSRGPDHAIVGNRSDTKRSNAFLFGIASNSAYVFQSNSGNLWTFEDIVNYLLTFLKPYNQTWALTGNVEALRQVKDVVSLEGKSVWTALNMLINRNRGLGFAIRPQPNTQLILLDVFTNTSRPIQVRGAYLPASYRQAYLQIPTDPPYNHYLGDIDFMVTATSQFDDILLRGRPAICTAYFSHTFNGSTYSGAPITQGWTSTIQTAYCNDMTGDAEKNDRIRGGDVFETVFASHIVKPEWTGIIRQFDTGVFFSTVPYVDNLANVTLNDDPYPPYQGNMRFLRHTGFKEGWDYANVPAGPTASYIVDTIRPDYVPLMALVEIPDPDSPGSTFVALANRLHDINDDYSNATVRSLDDQFGISVRWTPNHYVAPSGTTVNETVEDQVGDFDWMDVSFVGSFETEYRPTIKLHNFFSTFSDVSRTLTYDVPADFWFCLPGTPYEMAEDGGMYVCAAENTILRDERYLLYVAAAFTIGWYGVFRQSCSFTVKKIMHVFDVGTLLKDIRTLYASEQIESVVTGRRINYLSGETTILTAYSDLDIKEFVDSSALGSEHYD
jgi:hypothetical protein